MFWTKVASALEGLNDIVQSIEFTSHSIVSDGYMKGAFITKLSVRVAARDNGSKYIYCGYTSYMNKVNASSTDPIKHGLTIVLYCILHY